MQLEIEIQNPVLRGTSSLLRYDPETCGEEMDGCTALGKAQCPCIKYGPYAHKTYL